jgi:hypothetical protein
MKAEIKMLQTDKLFKKYENGKQVFDANNEPVMVKDYWGIYWITDATDEELERYKALKESEGSEVKTDVDNNNYPLYFVRGINPATIEVIIATNKKGEDYDFVTKDLMKGYLKSKIDEANAVLDINPNDRTALRAFDKASDKLEEYELGVLAQLQAITARNRVKKSVPDNSVSTL